MDKPVIDEFQYVELMNEKMKEHDEYTEGMHVEIFPGSSERPTGTRAVGEGKVGLVAAWADREIKKQYAIVVTT